MGFSLSGDCAVAVLCFSVGFLKLGVLSEIPNSMFDCDDFEQYVVIALKVVVWATLTSTNWRRRAVNDCIAVHSDLFELLVDFLYFLFTLKVLVPVVFHFLLRFLQK